MKKTKIASEIHQHKLNHSFKSTRHFLSEEQHKHRKLNEEKFQSKQLLQEIKKNVVVENLKKRERLSQVESGVKHRQEINNRREER
jgi:hypothetical protein